MRILLIEDEPLLGQAVQEHIAADGHAVDRVGRLDQARAALLTVDYGLILLDLHLPDGRGLDLLRDLRRRGDTRAVIILTARDQINDRIEGLNAGADDYLVKPFSFPVLVARVRALLRRAAGRTPAPLSVGDLRIDPAERRVWRGDVEIGVTSRQFDVLEFLVRRAGQVLSKADILAGVWPYDFDGDPNIVEVYIGRLRRALDEPFGRHTIETVRGAGYRVAVDGR